MALCGPDAPCTALPKVCLENLCRLPWGREVVIDRIMGELAWPFDAESDEPREGLLTDPYLRIDVDGREAGRTEVLRERDGRLTWTAPLQFTIQQTSIIQIAVYDDDSDGGGEDDLLGGLRFDSGRGFVTALGPSGGLSPRTVGDLRQLAFWATFR